MIGVDEDLFDSVGITTDLTLRLDLVRLPSAISGSESSVA